MAPRAAVIQRVLRIVILVEDVVVVVEIETRYVQVCMLCPAGVQMTNANALAKTLTILRGCQLPCLLGIDRQQRPGGICGTLIVDTFRAK